MDGVKPNKPRRQTNPPHMDSDDEVGNYEYKRSQRDDAVRKSTRSKHSQPSESGRQSHGLNSPNDGHPSSSDEQAAPEAESEEELDDEEHPRHPFYDYATEKSDVAADAKLIYQRHRLDTESESGGSPYLHAKSHTMPVSTLVDTESGLARTSSVSSRRSKPSQSILAQTIGKPAIPANRTDSYIGLQDSANLHKNNLAGLALAADDQARARAEHPNLPQGFTDPLLAGEGVHGAGAGVGLGQGPQGFATNDGAILSEVEAICDKIKHILDLRQAYMKVSNQCPGDNPKDHPSFKIYPEPPEPVWNEEKSRPIAREDGNISASSSLYMADPKSAVKDGFKWGTHINTAVEGGGTEQTPVSPTSAKRRRKPGTDIGTDFDINDCEIPGRQEKSLDFEMDAGGIFQVNGSDGKPIVSIPTLRDYYKALDEVLDIASEGPCKSFAYRRLQYLEGRYQLYTLLNEYEEVADTKKVPHRDFYNVRKVDTHVHHSACMNQKHLLRFIKSKMKKCSEDLVLERDGKQLTLAQVFESIDLTAYDLSIDTLDMHAHTDSFHRFDKFNLKYNPVGQSRLRDIFLKTDNFVKGRYLAEITREVISDLESSKYQMVEWRISIYGRSMAEWDKLAAWVVDNKLFSPNVRWLVQIPRLFSVYKSLNTMQNFEQLLRNIFQPLFEVTKDPTTHPKLHIFLQRVIGFDSVDDESKPEKRMYRKFPIPKEWNTKQNPPYGYWIYYLFANMASLNAWRKRRGFNTFLLRPHCGEAGDIDHLAAAVLCCHSISHGITLRKVPLLQYIFYLDQVGIAMSPLSNNALFLTYDRNPFISYFKKGLNVSLSTDDPLQFAFTKEPLIEEYSVAAQIYKLSAVDMCELAKHSVDQCGFELALKRRWLGRYCYLPGVLGNDVRKCNVPDIREAFRHETLRGEHAFIARYTHDQSHQERCTPTLPDPAVASTPIGEVYKTFESPTNYFATVADSITPAQLARQTGLAMSSSSTTGTPVKTSGEFDHQPRTGLGQSQTNYARARAASRSSMVSNTPSQPEGNRRTSMDGDQHISGQEPRAFPGFLVETMKRKNSVRSSMHGLGVGGITGSSTWTPGAQHERHDRNYSAREQEKEKEQESEEDGVGSGKGTLEDGFARMSTKEDFELTGADGDHGRDDSE